MVSNVGGRTDERESQGTRTKTGQLSMNIFKSDIRDAKNYFSRQGIAAILGSCCMHVRFI